MCLRPTQSARMRAGSSIRRGRRSGRGVFHAFGFPNYVSTLVADGRGKVSAREQNFFRKFCRKVFLRGTVEANLSLCERNRWWSAQVQHVGDRNHMSPRLSETTCLLPDFYRATAGVRVGARTNLYQILSSFMQTNADGNRQAASAFKM